MTNHQSKQSVFTSALSAAVSGEGDAVWSEAPAQVLRVRDGFVLADVDSSATPGLENNKQGGQRAGEALFENGRVEANDLQERLWAESRFGATRCVLVVLQGMDTAGKGGIVKHVFGGIDPQGVTVVGFTKPTPEELSHDFLWRVRSHLPTSGMLGVFDRSHYEDVLIGRVHNLATPAEIDERYGRINEFEQKIIENGTTILKVMLHISADEQKSRLADRLNRPEKHWKYAPSDLDERALWPQYQNAYQRVFERTSTSDAPWFVVPADHKWYARLAVQQLLVEALRGLCLTWPAAHFDLAAERARLGQS